MIKNIILDMGNVLLDYNPNVSLEKFCKSDEAKSVIMRELFGGPEWVEGDLGNISDSDRYELVKKRVPEAYHDELKNCAFYWDICMKPLNGAAEFCDYVKSRGYGIYVLSNASDKFYEYFPKFKPLEFFDGVVVSCDLHVVKPDLRIYEYLLQRYGLEPAECLFIDDRKDNVDGAAAAGMQAMVFEGSFDEVKKRYSIL